MDIQKHIYENSVHTWWSDNGEGNLVSLSFLSNPIKFNNIHAVINNKLRTRTNHVSLLDIGCSGHHPGNPEKTGIEAIGIDFSHEFIESTPKLVIPDTLSIKHLVGGGEELPLESNTCDFVCCCDVMKHFKDFRKILGEISRVLKNDGVFFYDTMNRTSISKLIITKIIHKWHGPSFLDPDIHTSDMFIESNDLLKMLNDHFLISQGEGPLPATNFIFHFYNLRKSKKWINMNPYKHEINSTPFHQGNYPSYG